MITKVDPIVELDGGGPMGFLLYGDVTFEDVEAFMADGEVEEYFPDGADFDAVECYVRKVPYVDEYGDRDGSMRYVYASGPGRGAAKVTRLEVNTSWGHWCMNHIYEPASTGIPVEQVADPIWPMVNVRISDPKSPWRRARGPHDGEAYVYLCRPCANRFSERRDEAMRERLAALRTHQQAAS